MPTITPPLSEFPLSGADPAAPPTIDYFNAHHPLHVLKERAALGARRRMYERVLELARPDAQTRIVDVGTTPDLALPYNNFFERWYPHRHRLSACSIEDCSSLEAQFPGLSFRLITGERLPYDDREFDLALSFAVLEHVGSAESQRRFLTELARVADAFILYTPYRYFPMEMHTLLPLLHWLPVKWHRSILRRLGMTFWAEEQNLNLLSVRSIRRLLPPGRADIRLLWSVGCPSNLEVHWRRH